MADIASSQKRGAQEAAQEGAPGAQKPAGKPESGAPKGPATIADALQGQTTEDLQLLSQNLAQAMTRANDVFAKAFHTQAQAPTTSSPDPFDVQGALKEVWSSIGAAPEPLREAHADLWQRFSKIWTEYSTNTMFGQDETTAEPPRDKRFRDPEWRTNPAFALLRETYLATSQWIMDLVENAEGLDEAAKRKAAFFVRQAVDAAAPSNFVFSNPAVLRATIATRGENLLRGMENLREDLERGKGFLSIRQTDLNAFKVGENIAMTPGKVVYRNRLFELLQYTPSTETVHEIPLLIFPPWINKFYIMDLQAKNSLIKWLVDQGHTVFVAAWVNPNAELSELGFEDYMREGALEAVSAVQKACGAVKMNAVGYCIGGTLLATTLAYMAAVGDERIQSATFYAAQTDFKLAGDLLVFTDEPGIKYVAERIAAHGGFLDAQAMADTFNALRANDLIWNYVVDNYYLGKDPQAFDLLFWNADQTRMPKTLHLFYLNNMYKDNALAEGRLTLLGEKIDLSKVKIPIYMQSAKEDHIAPFPSVYRSARLFGGPVRFLLAGSGHIAGVINHPDAKKYQYWVNEDLPPTVEEWVAGAKEVPGSWWPNWNAWLGEISGPQVPARRPGDGEVQVLGDAPGSYVMVRSQG